MNTVGIYNLVGVWLAEANECERKAEKMRPHAGHSDDEKGTGDEGWREMTELYERAGVLRACATELKNEIGS